MKSVHARRPSSDHASPLPPPYGARLVERLVEAPMALPRGVRRLPVLTLGDQDLNNLYNLAQGFYSPLEGFMGEADYRSVVARGQLASGLEWQLPIILPVGPEWQRLLRVGDVVRLSDPGGRTIGCLEVSSIYAIDRTDHVREIYGTSSRRHPGVAAALARPADSLGGRVELWVRPPRVQGVLVRTPREMRRLLAETGRSSFTSFSTRNVCHLGHEYLHALALEMSEILVINIIVGAERAGSFRSEVVAKIYGELLKRRYPRDRVLLNGVRLPLFQAGPKEAWLQAVMMQNLGFTHFIVGRDHAGVGGFYGKYASQRALSGSRDLRLAVVALAEPRWCQVCGRVTSARTCRHSGTRVHPLSGIDVRHMIVEGRWMDLRRIMSDDVIRLLRQTAGKGGRRNGMGSALFHEDRQAI